MTGERREHSNEELSPNSRDTRTRQVPTAGFRHEINHGMSLSLLYNYYVALSWSLLRIPAFSAARSARNTRAHAIAPDEPREIVRLAE